MLSVIVPAYNEEKRIVSNLVKVNNYFQSIDEDFEIIGVDDGSSDQTLKLMKEIAEDIEITVLSNDSNRGKGFSVRKGFLKSSGELVLFSDADLSTPLREYERLKASLVKGNADAVIGSRALPDSNIRRRQNLLRVGMGKTFNLLVRTLTGLPFRDTQCGFKLFRKEPFETIFESLETEGFAFDVEILLKSREKGLTVKELPVEWINKPDTSVHIITDSLKMLIEIAKIRFSLL